MLKRLIRLLPASLFPLLVMACQSARPVAVNEGRGEASGATSSLAVDAADGSLLKVSGGLFRSSDRGQSWKRIALPAELHPDKLRQILTSPAAPGSLYAAGPGVGVLRSDDRGENWRRVGAGLPSQEVSALAVHTTQADTLYAYITGQGVFRTEDGGGRWQRMDDGPSAPVVALAHSTLEGSMNTGWLYAASPQGVYLSMDCF